MESVDQSAEQKPAIKEPARIIGKICAKSHGRIVYYDAICPLCMAMSMVAQAGKVIDSFREHYRKCNGKLCREAAAKDPGREADDE